ncbi:MAG: hypothetical protein GY944_25730, partial [bacterium]|nr:hypothetical protein [bacterium]
MRNAWFGTFELRVYLLDLGVIESRDIPMAWFARFSMSAASSSESVTRSCPICESGCGLRLEVDREQKKILSVRGDEDDPRSQGYVCPKATAVKGLYEDPDRIKKPLRKTDAGWQEISFE